MLWEKVCVVNLQENCDDSIPWRWTNDGEYTTKSACQIQFEGAFSKLRITPIWRARAEPRCRFFLLGPYYIRRYSPPTYNLMKQNWAHDPICKLCGVYPDANSPLQRLPLLEAGLVLSQTMATSNGARLGGNEWIGSLRSYWRK